MSDDRHDAFDEFLDAFGAELERAAARPARRRVRPRFALAAGTAAIAAAGFLALLLGPGGGRHLDVVAEARAALVGDGQLVHIVLRQSLEGGAGASASTVEQWSASAPARSRIAFTIPAARAGREGKATVSGPVEVAYGDDAQSTYVERRNTLTIVRGLDELTSAATIPDASPLGGNPVGTLRRLLTLERLRDAGALTERGRRLRRLVGRSRWRFGSSTVTTAVEYRIDAATFAPVAARLELPVPPARSGRARTARSFLVLGFERYERLALTPRRRRLLEIHPARPPKVIERTLTAAQRDLLLQADD